MKKLTIAVLASALFLQACTNAEQAQWSAYGNPGDITCYSGGTVTYAGRSTGKIKSESQSDGWYFEEAGTNDLIRVSGACVIRNRTGSAAPVAPPKEGCAPVMGMTTC